MDINFESIIYIFSIIIPGFIILNVLEMLMPMNKVTENERIIYSVGYGVMNYCLWFWLYKIIYETLLNNTILFWISQSVVIVVSGFLTGLCLGMIRKMNVIQKFLGSFGIETTHPIPHAWDYVFSSGNSYYVEIGLSNGEVIRGLYSGQSFSSSNSDFFDIYIEKQFIKKNEFWECVERTCGVWVSPNEIRYIKFYDVEDNNE